MTTNRPTNLQRLLMIVGGIGVAMIAMIGLGAAALGVAESQEEGEAAPAPSSTEESLPAAELSSPLAAHPPRFWAPAEGLDVVEVVAEPNAPEVIRALAPTDNVRSTGVSADVDGAAWSELQLEADVFGWVRSDSLRPVNNPIGNPNWMCALGTVEGGTVMLLVDETSDPVDGILRSDRGDGTSHEYARITARSDGAHDVVRTDLTGNSRSVVWTSTSDGSGLVLDDGTVVTDVDCDDVAGWANESVALLWATE